MAKIPEKVKQIAITHAPLINSVVMACQNDSYLTLLEPELIKAEQNGWIDLVKQIRKILAGSRKQNLLKGLDEEDAGIVLAILVGIQDPEAVKNLNKNDKKTQAPIAIAKLIQDAWSKGQESQELSYVIGSMKSSGKQDISQLVKAIEFLVEKDIANTDKVIEEIVDENNLKFINSIREELKI